MKSGDWSYEEEISLAIITELAKSDAPTFLDIGAHTGFMTLNVLAKIPFAHVFAFEPGILQSSLFEKTIEAEANNLKDKVTLYKEALGCKTGTISFSCQESPDADWSMSLFQNPYMPPYNKSTVVDSVL
jgi:FkbM family methyltransferase